MKSKWKLLLFISLAIILSINYPGQGVAAETQKETYLKRVVPISRNEVVIVAELQRLISLEEGCDEEDITVIDKENIKNEITVEHTAIYNNNKTLTAVDTFTFTGVYTETELYYKVEDAILEKHKDIKELVDVSRKARTSYYETTYMFTDWEEIYNQSLAMTYKLPSTKRDTIAELSPVTFYFQGYRIPYLLEDAGELYIECEYMDNPLIFSFDREDFYYSLKESYTFRNYNYKSFAESGTKIAKITATTNGSIFDFSEKYAIGNTDYYKLSEVLEFLCEDWRDNQLTYDKKSKTLYYERKPTDKELNLMEDSIYEFVNEAIKGCTTDKEKVIAIHDAIIKACQYDSNASYYKDSIKEYYDIANRIDIATKVLKNKKGNDEALAILFQESCRRLFIPCDLIYGQYTWPEFVWWNKIYINSELYHMDVVSDLKGTANKNNISRKNCFKTPYDFMGTHTWDGSDYKLEEFSTSWESIDRNNIKTTEELRRAVVYASYLSQEQRKTYTFKIKSDSVQTDCANYVMSYRFVSLAKQEYKNGELKVKFN